MIKHRYPFLTFLLLVTIVLGNMYPVYGATQTSITRSQVEARALTMINLKWTYSQQTNSGIDATYTSAVAQPKQFANVTKGEMVGIPYCWGGMDSTETASYSETWKNFTDAVSKGAYAGNVNTTGGYGHVPKTAGLDCSGFVQSAFNIKDYKQSTTTLLSTYFTQIKLSELKHMDILDRPGDHVVIFDKWGTLNGVEGAYTYESTSATYFGGIQGTKKYFITMSQINSGYIPARYKYITEDTASPTPTPTPVATPTPTPTATPAPVATTAPTSLPHPVNVGQYAQVTNMVSYVNLRSAASSSSSVVQAVPGKGILYISSYSLGWYKVVYNGTTGWIYGNYITELPSGKYVTVKDVTLLNIRSGPSSTSAILGTLGLNQFAEVIDYSGDSKWAQIKYNNILGWASLTYLKYIY